MYSGSQFFWDTVSCIFLTFVLYFLSDLLISFVVGISLKTVGIAKVQSELNFPVVKYVVSFFSMSLIVLQIKAVIKRLTALNLTAWYSVLYFLPIINLIFYFYLLFADSNWKVPLNRKIKFTDTHNKMLELIIGAFLGVLSLIDILTYTVQLHIVVLLTVIFLIQKMLQEDGDIGERFLIFFISTFVLMLLSIVGATKLISIIGGGDIVLLLAFVFKLKNEEILRFFSVQISIYLFFALLIIPVLGAVPYIPVIVIVYYSYNRYYWSENKILLGSYFNDQNSSQFAKSI